HKFFKSTRLNPSFYNRGAAGRVAWVVLKSLTKTNPHVKDLLARLIEANTLDEQREIYNQIKPLFWNALNCWLVNHPLTMAMLGVPRAQIGLIENETVGGLAGYIQKKIEHVMTRLPLPDNYFWRVYITGRYTSECCPNYLRPEYHSQLRMRTARVNTHTT